MGEPNMKASQPRHEEMAQQVSRELIENFSAEEQYQFIESVKDRLNSSYKGKIEEADSQLKSLHSQFEAFKGNHLLPGVEDNPSQSLTRG